MDYKTEMRKLIDIVKQQSFDAPLESTLEDLTTLSTAVKDLSDRINTRTKKSTPKTITTFRPNKACCWLCILYIK